MGERESPAHVGAREEQAAALSPKAPAFSVKNIAVLLVGVAVSTFFAIFTVGSYLAPAIEEKREERSQVASEVESELESLNFFTVDPLIVNPAQSNGERYLKATVSLETHDPDLLEEMKKRLPQIKNQINAVLSSKTIEQIGTNEDRERLRREIQNRVNGLLLTGRVSNVYFEEFVCQ